MKGNNTSLTFPAIAVEDSKTTFIKYLHLDASILQDLYRIRVTITPKTGAYATTLSYRYFKNYLTNHWVTTHRLIRR